MLEARNMHLFAAQKHRFMLRAAVFFGVLSGLLFSCGEGIRLFPFPPMHSLTSVWKGKAENIYQKNFHRFENKQTSYQAKNQRANQQFWANNFAASNFAPRLTASNVFLAASSLGFEIGSGRISPAFAGGRAPPFS